MYEYCIEDLGNREIILKTDDKQEAVELKNHLKTQGYKIRLITRKKLYKVEEVY